MYEPNVCFLDVPEERSLSGLCQCLVELSTQPITVCHGFAPNQDGARASAAHNALQYLKIMAGGKWPSPRPTSLHGNDLDPDHDTSTSEGGSIFQPMVVKGSNHRLIQNYPWCGNWNLSVPPTALSGLFIPKSPLKISQMALDNLSLCLEDIPHSPQCPLDWLHHLFGWSVTHLLCCHRPREILCRERAKYNDPRLTVASLTFLFVATTTMIGFGCLFIS